jgi:gamma-glutamylcyclotransferase (GGCT)/AIG2-like uncharacterized protein YtfP
MLYFAYGANLNLRGLKRRCPKAAPVTTATLKGYRLEFRTYATIVADPKAEVLGALYRLTPQCFRSLDEYEGPEYKKITVTVIVGGDANGESQEATAYMMHAGERAPPSVMYFTDIARGYADWKLDVKVLRRARYALLQPERRPAKPLPPRGDVREPR